MSGEAQKAAWEDSFEMEPEYDFRTEFRILMQHDLVRAPHSLWWSPMLRQMFSQCRVGE